GARAVWWGRAGGGPGAGSVRRRGRPGAAAHGRWSRAAAPRGGPREAGAGARGNRPAPAAARAWARALGADPGGVRPVTSRWPVPAPADGAAAAENPLHAASGATPSRTGVGAWTAGGDPAAYRTVPPSVVMV